MTRVVKLDQLEVGKLYAFAYDGIASGSTRDRRLYGSFIEIRAKAQKPRQSWKPERVERFAVFKVVGFFDKDGRAVTEMRGIGRQIGQIVERRGSAFDAEVIDPDAINRAIDEMQARWRDRREALVAEARQVIPILRRIEAFYHQATDMPYGLRQALYNYDGVYRPFTDEEAAENLVDSGITVRLEDILPLIARLLAEAAHPEEADHG